MQQCATGAGPGCFETVHGEVLAGHAGSVHPKACMHASWKRLDGCSQRKSSTALANQAACSHIPYRQHASMPHHTATTS